MRLSGKEAQKLIWVLRLVEELDTVPNQYFKKLPGTAEIWEVLADYGGNAYRLLGFFDGTGLVILTNGFAKKSRKAPRQEIALAEERRRDYQNRNSSLSDLRRYTKARAEVDPEFAEGLEQGYPDFKIGVLLRQAREQAGLTQEEIARRIATKKSAISRIENHAGDIRLSTLERYAQAVGCQLFLELRPPTVS